MRHPGESLEQGQGLCPWTPMGSADPRPHFRESQTAVRDSRKWGLGAKPLTFLLAIALGVPSIQFAHADPGAGLLGEIARAQALPPALRRQRLLALAGGAPDRRGQRAAAIAAALVADGDPAAAAFARAAARAATPEEEPAPAPALAPAPAPAENPAAALAFNQAVLRRDPGNDDARVAAVQAALQVQSTDVAGQLAADAIGRDPNDPTGWLLAARIARRRHEDQIALLDAERARDLRSQQMGSDTGDSGDPGIAAPTDLNPPATPAPYRAAQSFYTNPFRNQPQTITPAAPHSTIATDTDPMTQQIDGTLATLQQEVAPRVMAELDMTGRSGGTGLSGLGALALPLEATFSPNGYGALRFVARPTLLFAGHVGSTPLQQAQFGTAAFSVTAPTATTQGFVGPTAGYQDAKGVSFDVDYAYSWIEADMGSTPVGFAEQNVQGGLTLTPQLTSTVGLRLTAERRPVTDSLLAYAGVVDPRTGNTMGGVMRDRVYAQLNWNDGGGFWYAGAGGDYLRGENVESNREIEAGAGLSYPIWTSRTDEVRLGLNMVYFGFRRNLDNFTLGQGGYFSPQTYAAGFVPVSYSENLGRLSYLVRAALGLQTYHQDGSVYFPTNPALQTALDDRAPFLNGLQTSYAGQSDTGIAGNVHGEIQYQLTPNFDLGGAATFERAGNFDQGEGVIYARYIFDGVR